MPQDKRKPARTRVLKIVAIPLVIASLTCCIGSGTKVLYDRFEEAAALSSVTTRLGVQREWPAVHDWLNDRLIEGLSRAEVHAIFREVGDCEVLIYDVRGGRPWDPVLDRIDVQEYIRFTSPEVYQHLQLWTCKYEPHGTLWFCSALES